MKRKKHQRNKFRGAFFATLCTGALLLGAPGEARAREMSEQPRIKLRSLEKTTARTVTFEADVGSTLKFGTLFIKVQSCQKTSPVERPEAAAFLQIWENPPDKDKAEWVFSGWMFSSSPALSPMDHAIYDVWVLDCIGAEGEQTATAVSGETDGEAAITAEGTEQPPETRDFNSLLQGITGVDASSSEQGTEDAGDAAQTGGDSPPDLQGNAEQDAPLDQVEPEPVASPETDSTDEAGEDETYGLPGGTY